MHHVPPGSSRLVARALRRLALLGGAVVGAAALASCIHVFYKTDARDIAIPSATTTPFALTTPVKAHLRDGSTVIFAKGATMTPRWIVGRGERYAVLARASTVGAASDSVPVDSLLGLETFEGTVLAAPTIFTTLAATAVGVVAAAGLAVAIFGSCPTVYADSGANAVLQAEGFSYSIAPLLEHRDLDALRIAPNADGVARLELRNEALETHFINHVELLAVSHAPGEDVVSDQGGQPVIVGDWRALRQARDRAGRDLRGVLRGADGQLFATAPTRLAAANARDLDDWIDLDLSDLPAGDSVAVVLRLRNSLLNTVLLYEGMLGGRDAGDWLTNGLQRISNAVDVARWYNGTMGMRVTVDGLPVSAEAARFGHARLGDVGPIAFRDVAVVLPRPARDTSAMRVHLQFVADNWRIDQVRIAGRFRRVEPTTIPVARVIVPQPVTGGGPVHDGNAVLAVADADERYLETRPGQRMVLEFDVPKATAGETRYLIAWQGWYREWLRPQWLTNPTRTTAFVPGNDAVFTALTSWRAQQSSFERAFYSSRIATR